jgi:hypothetical protein
LKIKPSIFFVFIIGVLTTSQGCNFLNKQGVVNKELAIVKSNTLYYNEIEKLIPPDATPNDSTQLVNGIVDEWVRHQLILQLAEDNKGNNAIAIDKQVKDYTESLLIYYYENELIRYKLDSVVQLDEITNYYNSNNIKFTSTSDLIRCVMIKTRLSAQMQDTLRLWLTKWNDQSPYHLDGYCNQYAESCHLQFKSWYSPDGITIKAGNANIKPSLLTKNYFETTDTAFRYFVKVFETKPQGAIMPIDFVRDDIRSQILNKRKTEFMKKVYDKIYTDGVKDNSFEIKHYDPKK